MTTGIPFTEREKKYIIENEEYESRSQIAKHLCEMYPEDNDGKRTMSGVRSFLRKQRDKT